MDRSSGVNPLLELRAVSRRYGDAPNQVVALDHVDLLVEAGEMVAVMGPSGSGKSTLLSIAGGLETPTAGEARLDGTDLWAASPAALAAIRRRSIGYVFQELNLLTGLTAAENVAAPLELDGVPTSAAEAEAVRRLDEVGMADRADAVPDDLSGGERQRVAIARALVGSRRLVLADEPTGALDTANGETIAALLRHACRDQRAVVLVTHDAELARWADRIVHLRDGRIVGTSEPSTPATASTPGPGAGTGTATAAPAQAGTGQR